MPLRTSQETQETKANQGGDIVVTYKDDVTTLDPAIGYDWQNWSMIKSLFDGLMDYEPGTTKLRARARRKLRDLARRQDLHLQAAQGRQVLTTAASRRRRREIFARTRTNPKTQSPGAGFFGAIKGYEDVTGGKAESLSGIGRPDASTVKFELSRPDATFLHVMAINFATSCRRRKSRNTAPISARTRSAPAPSS
jgi:oligopeptide transport system substrate-binding protein